MAVCVYQRFVANIFCVLRILNLPNELYKQGTEAIEGLTKSTEKDTKTPSKLS